MLEWFRVASELPGSSVCPNYVYLTFRYGRSPLLLVSLCLSKLVTAASSKPAHVPCNMLRHLKYKSWTQSQQNAVMKGLELRNVLFSWSKATCQGGRSSFFRPSRICENWFLSTRSYRAFNRLTGLYQKLLSQSPGFPVSLIFPRQRCAVRQRIEKIWCIDRIKKGKTGSVKPWPWDKSQCSCPPTRLLFWWFSVPSSFSFLDFSSGVRGRSGTLYRFPSADFNHVVITQAKQSYFLCPLSLCISHFFDDAGEPWASGIRRCTATEGELSRWEEIANETIKGVHSVSETTVRQRLRTHWWLLAPLEPLHPVSIPSSHMTCI